MCPNFILIQKDHIFHCAYRVGVSVFGRVKFPLHRHVHSAKIATPLAECCRADADLTAEVGHTLTPIAASEHSHDLAVGKTGFLHLEQKPIL